jgi:hypothetical protein
MLAPASFVINPRDAYIRVASSRRLSLKHRWFCFRDEVFYYVADSFGREISARTARRHGIRVHGITGELE